MWQGRCATGFASSLSPFVMRVFTGAQSYVVEHRVDVAAAIIDRLAPFTMARPLRVSTP